MFSLLIETYDIGCLELPECKRGANFTMDRLSEFEGEFLVNVTNGWIYYTIFGEMFIYLNDITSVSISFRSSNYEKFTTHRTLKLNVNDTS